MNHDHKQRKPKLRKRISQIRTLEELGTLVETIRDDFEVVISDELGTVELVDGCALLESVWRRAIRCLHVKRRPFISCVCEFIIGGREVSCGEASETLLDDGDCDNRGAKLELGL